MTKALRLFQRAERGILVAGMLFFLAYFSLLVNNTTLSTFLRGPWAQRHDQRTDDRDLAARLRNSLGAKSLKTLVAEFFRALRSPHVLLAGIALGLATGVRAVGPLAGVIIVLYLFVKVRSRAWTTAMAYFLIAGIITYIAWPRLWDAPVQRYLEALGNCIELFPFSGTRAFQWTIVWRQRTALFLFAGSSEYPVHGTGDSCVFMSGWAC